MTTVPPGHGTGQPEDPQVDPSGRWQWDAQQQQHYGAAPADGGYPPDPNIAAPGPYPAGPPPQQKKSRKGLLIMAVVAVAVIVVGVVVAVVAGGGSSAPPSATVTTYLADLENGNASGAVAQGATPASTTFLTEDILKQQQAKARISGVKIISTDIISSNEADVHATYQFGSRSADETFGLTKSGGKWKLTQSAYQIDVSDLSNMPQVTLFGKPIANLSKVYVFPGPVLWGTANKYFTVTDTNADKYALSPYDTSDALTSLNATLSSTGKTAVKNAVTAFIAKCAQSKQLLPNGCPQQEYGDPNGIPVDGTVTWTAPTDLSGLTYQPEPDVTKIDIQGSTVWQDTYQSKAFTNNSVSTITNSNNKTDVNGTVDLTQNPPLYTGQ